MKIKRLKANTILNSKGEKAIEVTVNGKFTASAPSGTSKGKHEARDFPSSGIPTTIVNRTISKKLTGVKVNDFKDLEDVEEILEEYGINKLGGNTVIAIEFALLKAASKNEIWKLLNPSVNFMPKLLGNCIGGGGHFKGESTDIQEFLLSPDTKVVRDADFVNRKIYTDVGKILKASQKTLEGAWVTQKPTEHILRLLNKLAKESIQKYDIKVNLGIDMAATSLFKNNIYHYKNKMRTREEQIDYVNNLISKYKLHYVEDPMMEDDFEGFGEIKGELVCADDLVCTDVKRLDSAKEYISAVIIKPNQVGSLIKTKQAVDFARKNGIISVISHRSGETTDTTIADLAVGWEIPYIKCGIAGKERVVKLNRLKNIETSIR